jgi:hypothetical protein
MQIKIKHPITKIPESIDHVLYLISQELKIRRFFDGLQRIGIDDCSLEPHLDRIILAELGLDDGLDNTTAFYCEVIEKRSKKINGSAESVLKQSFKAYAELTAEKARRKNHTH